MRVKPMSINDVVDFVKICSNFPEDIDVSAGRYVVDAKSILGVVGISTLGDIDVKINTDDQSRWVEFRNAIKEYLYNVD